MTSHTPATAGLVATRAVQVPTRTTVRLGICTRTVTPDIPDVSVRLSRTGSLVGMALTVPVVLDARDRAVLAAAGIAAHLRAPAEIVVPTFLWRNMPAARVPLRVRFQAEAFVEGGHFRIDATAIDLFPADGSRSSMGEGPAPA